MVCPPSVTLDLRVEGSDIDEVSASPPWALGSAKNTLLGRRVPKGERDVEDTRFHPQALWSVEAAISPFAQGSCDDMRSIDRRARSPRLLPLETPRGRAAPGAS